MKRSLTNDSPGSIASALERRADLTPDAMAVGAPGRAPLTYRRLRTQIRDVLAQLRAFGIKRNERVALVLPQGPDTAVTFLSVAAGAACAPLNPAYGAREFEFYLTDLKARAVIVRAGTDSPVRPVASALGVPIIELTTVAEAEAGVFRLSAAGVSALPADDGPAEPDDLALVLHTSGTTARPKIVPLTQSNLCASARHMTAALGLTDRDRCLSVAALFHIHGLMVMLSSLWAGGAILSPSAFDARKFFGWLAELGPTWYTAVPTVHQAILAAAAPHRETIADTQLRFLRSSSAALPPRVASALEEQFRCPAIECYGMTEAAHQVACNQLPPGSRKFGSVGVPVGTELAILDEGGRPLPPGETGEIVIRGPNVMRGYENHPAANAAAFIDGWFRTGDQGHVDADGFVFITGRLKEIINRGGEKLSPREIDEVLLDHPAVAQAVTFPVPHPSLGEDIAAAVVLRNGVSATARAIREYAAAQLAAVKVPGRIVIVPRIPTGPTGKFQRAALAEQLGLLHGDMPEGERPAGRATVCPRDPLEHQLTQIWEDLFGRPVGITDDFFDLGGYSLLAVQMMAEIEKTCGRSVPLSTLFTAPTIQELAQKVRAALNSSTTGTIGHRLIELQRGGALLPVVFLNGDLYGGGFYCRQFVRHLPADQSFYMFSSHGVDGDPTPPTIEAMARAHLEILAAALPSGPCFLGGFSHGALVALEMAQQLRKQGKAVPGLFLVDAPVADPRLRALRALIFRLGRLRGLGPAACADAFIEWRGRIARWRRLSYLQAAKRLAAVLLGGHGASDSGTAALGGTPQVTLDARRQQIMTTYNRITGSYVPRKYAGRVWLVVAAKGSVIEANDPTLGWSRVAARLTILHVPGDHLTCVTSHGSLVAEQLRTCVHEALGCAEGRR